MKKMISVATLLIVAFALVSMVAPKKKKSHYFRGTVTYQMTYTSETLTDLQKAKLPTSLTVKMYDGMSMYDMAQDGGVLTYLTNPSIDTMFVMIEYGLKKAAIGVPLSKVNNDSAEAYTTSIEYSEDTKMIAGYLCKKANVTFTPKLGIVAEEVILPVFYSPELSDSSENSESLYAGINGFLLESYEVSPEVITKMTVSEVIKGKLSDLDFLLPSDYKVFKSSEELQKFFEN
jgi:hypothetical protein